MKSIHRILLAVLALGLLAGACGGGDEVGKGVKNVKPGDTTPGGGAIRDPNTTQPPATEKAVDTTAPPPTPKPTTPPPTQAERKCTQVKAGDGTIQDYINIGNANKPYNPTSAGFQRGALVCWKNTDTVAHGVEASNGAFSSGPIAPGEVYKWSANVSAGRINYADPDRPFAVGELIIQ